MFLKIKYDRKEENLPAAFECTRLSLKTCSDQRFTSNAKVKRMAPHGSSLNTCSCKHQTVAGKLT